MRVLIHVEPVSKMIEVRCIDCSELFPIEEAHPNLVSDKFEIWTTGHTCEDKKTNFEMVKEFHETFNPHQFLAYPVNSALPYNVEFLRERLIQEEFEETIIAIESRDVSEIAKELADLLYVVYGTAYTYGIDIDAVFAEVHKSNMSKVGDDGKPIQRADGKILKGPNYQEPDIAAVLRKKGAQI